MKGGRELEKSQVVVRTTLCALLHKGANTTSFKEFFQALDIRECISEKMMTDTKMKVNNKHGFS